jgi:hypothetical protein
MSLDSVKNVGVGIGMIILWLPSIFFTEINNKGNRKEFDLLKKYIKENMTVEAGKLTGSLVPILPLNKVYNTLEATNITEFNIVNEYIYILVKGTIIVTEMKDNKPITNKTVLPSYTSNNILYYNDIKYDNKDTLNYLAEKSLLDTRIYEIDDKTKVEIKIYGIIKDQPVLKINGLKEFESEIDMPIYDFEYANSIEEVTKILNDRKSMGNMIEKWLGRIVTFLLLFIGLSLLISPIRYFINNASIFPILNILLTPAQWIIAFYDILSFFGSFLITLITTIIVYCIINYPIISLVVSAILGGTVIFRKHTNKLPSMVQK